LNEKFSQHFIFAFYGSILLSPDERSFFLLYFTFKTFSYYTYGMILCDKKQIYFVNRPLKLLRFRQFGQTSIQPIREDQLKPPHSMNEGNSKTYNQLLNSLTKLLYNLTEPDFFFVFLNSVFRDCI
jgi:hypothetical protein